MRKLGREVAVSIEINSRALPNWTFVLAATGQVILSDALGAVQLRDSSFPPSTSVPTIGLIDFGVSIPTPGVLYEWVVPLGRRARGDAGFTLFVSSADPATRQMVSYVAAANAIPLYVTGSSKDIENAEPAGDLTVTEMETLDVLHRVGGTLSASDFGERVGVEATTAGNRLVTLAKKGYIHRIERSRREGDLFIDPRTVRPAVAFA